MAKTKKLPRFFEPILWSYNIHKIDLQHDKERIIINTINYGDWAHWQWIVNYYGTAEVKRVVKNTPKGEFRERALRLVSLLLEIKQMKYASRGIKIATKRNIS